MCAMMYMCAQGIVPDPDPDPNPNPNPNQDCDINELNKLIANGVTYMKESEKA
jgi:hypothetical protein